MYTFLATRFQVIGKLGDSIAQRKAYRSLEVHIYDNSVQIVVICELTVAKARPAAQQVLGIVNSHATGMKALLQKLQS